MPSWPWYSPSARGEAWATTTGKIRGRLLPGTPATHSPGRGIRLDRYRKMGLPVPPPFRNKHPVSAISGTAIQRAIQRLV